VLNAFLEVLRPCFDFALTVGLFQQSTIFTQLQVKSSDSMGPVVEKSCCSLCGKHRSGRARRAQDDRGLVAQVCSRRACAEFKNLLRKASRISSNSSSLVVEVHHYHHTSHANENNFDCTHIYSSELHAESLPKDQAVLSTRSALQGYGRLPTVRRETSFHRSVH
jgi:hypothetical protein